MTSAQMIERVKGRTKQNDDTKVIRELNAAQEWAYNKIYNSEGGPDLLITYGTEKMMSAQTRIYDLGANVSGTIYGIKNLWLRFPNETAFSPMRKVDATNAEFVFNDQWVASDTTTVATGHPVFYDMINLSQLRFAPPLPASSVIRVDYWRKPPDIEPTINPALTYGNDLPEPAHQPVVDKATATIFDLIDDDRAEGWEVRAERGLNDAMYLMRKRVQTPVRTQPFGVRRRRFI